MTLTDHLPLSVKSVTNATGWPRGAFGNFGDGQLGDAGEKRATTGPFTMLNRCYMSSLHSIPINLNRSHFNVASSDHNVSDMSLGWALEFFCCLVSGIRNRCLRMLQFSQCLTFDINSV